MQRFDKQLSSCIEIYSCNWAKSVKTKLIIQHVDTEITYLIAKGK